MFKDYCNTVYLVERKYKKQKGHWVCLTKERVEDTIRESKEDDMGGITYSITEIGLR